MLNPGEIGGIAGAGFVAIVGSTGYLSVVARRRRRFRRTLGDPDPSVRLAALNVVAERGVARYLDALTERALVEADPKVQRSLAWIVTRARWDSSSDPRLLQLKGWAERVTAAPPEKSHEPQAMEPPMEPTMNDGAPLPPENAPVNEPEQLEPDAQAESAEPGRDLGQEGLGRHDPVEAWLVPDPWADKPIEGTPNGARPDPDLETVAAREPTGAAKAEQSAVQLLREAGYSTERPQRANPEPAQIVPVEAEKPDVRRPQEPDVRQSQKPDLRQSLREILAQRIITVTILEEAARRMRAENDRLESTLTSEQD
jgi:hypothetical protein